ncbi:hypothetical protein MMC22_009806 [Lobaria immixta]|nr:hypothetical protein [Lobaria immixta]
MPSAVQHELLGAERWAWLLLVAKKTNKKKNAARIVLKLVAQSGALVLVPYRGAAAGRGTKRTKLCRAAVTPVSAFILVLAFVPTEISEQPIWRIANAVPTPLGVWHWR